MHRNTKIYYYADYIGKTEITDGDGNYTGESENSYSDVKTVRGNLSSATGYASVEPFGTFKDYDFVLVTDDLKCSIDENSIIWFLDTPKVQTGTIVPSPETLMMSENRKNSGIVKRVSKTLNVLSVAIKLTKQ